MGIRRNTGHGAIDVPRESKKRTNQTTDPQRTAARSGFFGGPYRIPLVAALACSVVAIPWAGASAIGTGVCTTVAPALSAQVTCNPVTGEGGSFDDDVTIPVGANYLQFTVKGAGGGGGDDGSGAAGGKGAQVTGYLALAGVTGPVTVKLGEGGGYNNSQSFGGSGGGASSLSASVSGSPTYLVIAGGGGGGGGYITGAAAGAGVGGNGSAAGTAAGGAGANTVISSQTAAGGSGGTGGTGGTGGNTSPAATGSCSQALPANNGGAATTSASGSLPSGGAGGGECLNPTGSTTGGQGGVGYGSGGGGAVSATQVSGSQVGGVYSAAGGGAGGSYTDPTRGSTVVYSANGASGGTAGLSGGDGQIVLTFLTALPGGGGGEGGGSGGGGSEPSEEPSPTPSASTSTPATPPVAPSSPTRLEPAAPGSNPNIPPAGLPAGSSVFLINGVPVPLTVSPNAPTDPVALVFTAPGLNMRLEGRGDDADPLGLTSKQALILQSEPGPRSASGRSLVLAKPKVQPTARTSGDGFAAKSPVKLYLLTIGYLGEVMTDATGAFAGAVPIPAGITPGVYTLQANGFAPDFSVRSLSIGVLVKSTAGRTATARTKVYFDVLSPALDAKAKSQLRAIARKVRADAVRSVVVGYVQPTSIAGNDQSLSSARARAVAAYLRAQGVTGVYVVRGDGKAKETGALARRVNVAITYRM